MIKGVKQGCFYCHLSASVSRPDFVHPIFHKIVCLSWLHNFSLALTVLACIVSNSHFMHRNAPHLF